MTTRRKVKTEFDEATDVTRATATDARPMDPNDDALDTVFSQFPQNENCLELWRTTEKGGKPVFLEDIMPSEFTFGNICREYGGGKYIVKGRYKGGEVTKRSFEIEGEPYPIKRKIPVSPGTQPAATVQPVQTFETVRREDGSYDMGALMTGMMTMMKSIVQESKGNKAEWLAELKSMREIFGNEAKPQTPIAEAIAMLKQGIELGQTAGGDGGGGGIPWMMVLEKLQGPLMEVASAIKIAVSQPRPGAMPLPNSIAPQPGAGQPIQPEAGQPEPAKPEGDQMEMILVAALTSMLPMLVTGAAKEADPGFYADLLLDQIPRQYYAIAKTWLEKGDCLDRLQTMNAGVAAHLIWFGSLRAELLKALAEELGDDGARSVQPQQTGDVATNGQADL